MSRTTAFAVTMVIMTTIVYSEQTVGLFLNEEGACEGYTLFAPCLWDKTYLIDNQGLVVNYWESEEIPNLGGMAYLSDEGYLYRSVYANKNPKAGVTGGVEKMDWNGNVVWYFEYFGDDYSPHHDMEVLPSGNVLMIAWETKSNAEAIQAGVDQIKIENLYMYSEYVVEIEPHGPDSGEVVWEWHAWDHLVQDYDPGVDNFGPVSAHPELIDINANKWFMADFIHFNSIDYNQGTDQIMLTSRLYNEVWIIDHSTTIEEASGHTGGNYGKGGDVLYRWGNPQAYNHGSTNDQVFFAPHDGGWIALDAPGSGNILVFNNGLSYTVHDYSSIDEFVPPVDENGNYSGGLPWGPDQLVWTYTAQSPQDFFSSFISGAQRLSNGNTLICKGPTGEFFEVTDEGEMVWHYVSPVSDKGPVFQGDSISNNSVFKIRRYPPDFPGFEGKDLTPAEPVELYPDDTAGLVSTSQLDQDLSLQVFPETFSRSTTVSYQMPNPGYVSIKLYNCMGQEVRTLINEARNAGSHQVVWDGTDRLGQKLTSGVYYCRLTFDGMVRHQRVLLVR